MLIDHQCPSWERRLLVSRPVEAPAATTFEAIRGVDFLESRVVALPNRARLLVDRLARGTTGPPVPAHFGFDQLLSDEGGFHLVAETPGSELVLGFVGRWWERGYGRVDWAPEQFRELDLPGYAVGAWGFTVYPYGLSTSVLVTDVRVRCTDDEARRAFRRYWTLVGPFVSAMGRPVLGLIRTEAEKRARGRPAVTDPTGP